MPVATGAVAAAALVALVWVTSGSADVPPAPVAAADQHAFAAPRASSSSPAATSAPPSTTETTSAPKPSATSSKTPKSTSRKPETPAAQACSSSLAGAQPAVARVGNHVREKFDVDSVGGRAGRSGTSDHPAGLALDFMVDPKTGDALAAYVLAHESDFGVKYVIWRQRYNDGGGWSAMEDRGGETANHYDHVHVSFVDGAKVSVTC
ncbi:hypothetical protein [Amycolatopsis jejuensis]|uniref:hypothetical protein n=1 Tax=Amycolatopsis jejuensis TaxID=330084 RepID=UPI001FE092BD|nr:hypothetical protein [Amycolatopsis jejuensis]